MGKLSELNPPDGGRTMGEALVQRAQEQVRKILETDRDPTAEQDAAAEDDAWEAATTLARIRLQAKKASE